MYLIDNENNQPIADAVALSDNKIVSASNTNGLICFDSTASSIIQFYHMAYEPLALNRLESDTIYLTAKTEVLDESEVIAENADPIKTFAAFWNFASNNQFNTLDATVFNFDFSVSINETLVEVGSGSVLVGYNQNDTKLAFRKLLTVTDSLLDSTALPIINEYGANRLFFIIQVIPFVNHINYKQAKHRLARNASYSLEVSDSNFNFTSASNKLNAFEEFVFDLNDSSLVRYISFYDLKEKHILPMQRKLIISPTHNSHGWQIFINVFDRIYITHESWLDIQYEISTASDFIKPSYQGTDFFPMPNYKLVKYLQRNLSE